MEMSEVVKKKLEETPYVTGAWTEIWFECPHCNTNQPIDETLFKNDVSEIVDCANCQAKNRVTK